MKTFIIIAIVISWIFILNLIGSIKAYFDSKTKHIKKTTADMDTITERVAATASFLKLIDTLIELEILSLTDALKLIRQPYNMLRLDKDVEEISSRVFHSIKEELYTNDELCIESDFILHFITSQVTVKVTEMVQSGNIQTYAEAIEKDNE